MSTSLSEVVPQEKIFVSKLKGKKIAFELYVDLYRYVKETKGSPAYLLKFLESTIKILEYKIKPCFVLDGPFPEVKRYPRISNKLEGPRLTATISKEIISNTMKLINLLGIPLIQAPFEAEAQAAYLAQKGDVWAVASHDFDALVYGTPRLILDLTEAKLRKQGKDFLLSGASFVNSRLALKGMGIVQEQLIMLAMIAGTDFNPGIYDATPKSAFTAIKKYKGKEDFMFKRLHWNYAYPWKEMFYFLRGIPVTNKYKLRFGKVDKEGIVDFLVHQNGLSKKIVEKFLSRIK